MVSVCSSTDVPVVATELAEKPLVRTSSADRSTCCSDAPEASCMPEAQTGPAEVAKAKVWPDLFADASRLASAEFKPLLAAATVLSRQHFNEDALENCSRKKGYRFLLVSSEDMQELYGFAVYKIKPALGTVAIQKLVVPGHLRNLGLGRALVAEVIAAGKALKLESIVLSSLPCAVPFYKRLGFKEMPDMPDALQGDDGGLPCNYIEGQIYMEFQLRKARKAGKGKKKR